MQMKYLKENHTWTEKRPRAGKEILMTDEIVFRKLSPIVLDAGV